MYHMYLLCRVEPAGKDPGAAGFFSDAVAAARRTHGDDESRPDRGLRWKT